MLRNDLEIYQDMLSVISLEVNHQDIQLDKLAFYFSIQKTGSSIMESWGIKDNQEIHGNANKDIIWNGEKKRAMDILHTLIEELQAYFLEHNLTNGQPIWHVMYYEFDFRTKQLNTEFYYPEHDRFHFAKRCFELGALTWEEFRKWTKYEDEERYEYRSDETTVYLKNGRIAHFFQPLYVFSLVDEYDIEYGDLSDVMKESGVDFDFRYELIDEEIMRNLGLLRRKSRYLNEYHYERLMRYHESYMKIHLKMKEHFPFIDWSKVDEKMGITE